MMQSDGDNELQGLDAELAIKEVALLAARVHQLESFLSKAEQEFSSLGECYQQLRTDFQFNLAILDERDRELERYDVLTARSLILRHNSKKRLCVCKKGLCLSSNNARQAGLCEAETDEQRSSLLASIAARQAGLREAETDEERRNRQVRNAESQARLRENETPQQQEEQQVKLMSKMFCQQIQTQLQHNEQEIKELKAAKDYRIKELEDIVKLLETKMKEEENNHIKKYEDVIRALKECDVLLETRCQVHTDQLQKAEEHIGNLQKSVEVLAAQARCLQADHQEAIQQKDEKIQRLHTDVEATRTGWDKYITQVSNDMVVKDTTIVTLQEEKSKLRTELGRSRVELERYKQQLSAGLKRETALEQMQVQVELEWQRRCEDMKAEHYLAKEQLILDLAQARDQAEAELKEKDQQLQNLIVLLHLANIERNQAVQGLAPKADCVASEEICRMQEQNIILRAVVTQMRKDIKTLSHLLPLPETSSSQPVHQETLDLMDTIPQAQSYSTSRAGGVCLENQVNTTEVKAPYSMGQSCLQHQQASGPMSADLIKNMLGAKSSRPVLHSRLKQAAFCIARLSREKQQLIELNNRLHGQIATTRANETDLSTEKLEERQEQLTDLEQLHYQLTTQELQYTLRQRAERLLPGTNERSPVDPWRQGTENKDDSPQLGQSQSFLAAGPQLHAGLSSEESLQSLNQLWQMIDYGLSPSTFSEGEVEQSRREVSESGGAVVQMMVVNGVSAPIHSQPLTEVQERRNPSTRASHTPKSSRSRAADRNSKIRNYNVKD